MAVRPTCFQTLKESELIYAIANTESKETMLYPRDARLEVQVDDDIKRLWDDVNMPGDDVELEREYVSRASGTCGGRFANV